LQISFSFSFKKRKFSLFLYLTKVLVFQLVFLPTSYTKFGRKKIRRILAKFRQNSGDSPLESEDPSALNSQAFPAVIAAEPVAPLPGTQQVASSTALSTPNSLASASSGMSPR
jgi:hypothetical protein